MRTRLLPAFALVLLLAAVSVGCSVSIDLTPPPAAGYVRLVSVESVYIRSCPSTSCDVRTVVFRGQAVRVYEYQNGWARVTLLESGATGWMDARYLRNP
jgi:uncharacterized protein YgiM (DUF1202 family)